MPDATTHYNLQKAGSSQVQNKWSLYDANFDLIERGRTISAIAGEALAAGDLAYIKAADGKFWKATNGNRPLAGIVIAAVGAGATAYAQQEGLFTLGTWTWTPWATVYAHASTAGALTQTKPSSSPFAVAIALSATSIWIFAAGLHQALPFFTAGSVIFAGADGGLTEDNAALFWDNAAKLLRIVGTAGTAGIGLRVTGDTQHRAAIYPDKIEFGPGNAATDIRLQRGAADRLDLLDELSIERAAAGNEAFRTFVTGEAFPRFSIDMDGRQRWGIGSGEREISLQYGDGNEDRLDLLGSLLLQRGSAPNRALSTVIPGDTVPRFSLSVDGKHEWGAGGASALDIALERFAAGVLGLTTGKFRVSDAGSGGSPSVQVGAATDGLFRITSPVTALGVSAAGNTGLYVTSSRRVHVGGNSALTTAALFVHNQSSASDLVALFRGNASQSADLTQWQNDAAAVLAAMGKDGDFRTKGLAVNIVSKTAAYTLTAADFGVLADASAGAFTLSLPTAVGIAGRMYLVKKVDTSANGVTIDPSGVETVDGLTTLTIYDAQKVYWLVSDGSNWRII